MTTVAECLTGMFVVCEEQGISISVSFNNGKYVDGVDVDVEHLDVVDPSKVKQGPKGWSIDVGEYGSKDLLPTLKDATILGMQTLKQILIEQSKQSL